MKKQISLFVPGRLCLFGEHSDWAGKYMFQNADVLEGQAIVTGINLGIYANVQVSETFDVASFTESGEKVAFSCSMNTKELKKYAAEPMLFSYCCGVAAYMRENYHVGGISIDITKVTLPMKKGLSSSAAICVLVAKAFNELYRLQISTRGIMQIAYRGELMTGSRCGRLDQACAYGETPVLMHFSENEIDIEKLRVGKNFYWVIADLCAGKDTKKILTYLNKCYPFALSELESNVQDALGKDNHKIIQAARQAIEGGKPEILGKIMVEAQSLFDQKIMPACKEELTAPVLHSVLNDPNIKEWIYGAKGVGSQGDGAVQLLAKDKKSQKALTDYLNNVRHMKAFAFQINAGGKIRKAIIPIAGVGSRMFPETFFIKKAFLPVIDENNVTKPVLMYLLEELVDAEIQDIYLIIGDNELDDYKKIFDFEFSEDFQKHLPENLRECYQKMYEISQHVHFVIQREKKGLGHAVYQAHSYLRKEPVLMLLGDFIYRSNLDISCTQQTINAYNKSGGKAVVSIKKVPFEQSSSYGIIHGVFETEHPYLMDVDNMVEKPSENYARENLTVIGSDGEKSCYATFGQYVLTDDIFQYLENQISAAEDSGFDKEIDITSALRHLAMRGELVGVDIDGISFDVGIPDMYYKTFIEYKN